MVDLVPLALRARGAASGLSAAGFSAGSSAAALSVAGLTAAGLAAAEDADALVRVDARGVLVVVLRVVEVGFSDAGVVSAVDLSIAESVVVDVLDLVVKIRSICVG